MAFSPFQVRVTITTPARASSSALPRSRPRTAPFSTVRNRAALSRSQAASASPAVRQIRARSANRAPCRRKLSTWVWKNGNTSPSGSPSGTKIAQHCAQLCPWGRRHRAKADCGSFNVSKQRPGVINAVKVSQWRSKTADMESLLSSCASILCAPRAIDFPKKFVMIGAVYPIRGQEASLCSNGMPERWKF